MDPLNLLEAITDPEDRIEAVAADLAAGTRQFASIPAWDLGELLGLDFEEALEDSDWAFTTLAAPVALADAGFEFPYAENLHLLKGSIAAARYAELLELAEADADTDIALTPAEALLLEQAYAEAYAEEGHTFGLARTQLTASDGTVLRFQVVVGDAGELEDPKGPYDEAAFIDPADFSEIG
jgi:hypothetical protein